MTLAGWAAGAQLYQRTAASRALEQYARSRGLVFAPAPSTPRGASPRVLGTRDGVAFVVDLYRLRGEVRTRVSASADRGRAPTLSVLQRGAFSFGTPSLRMGDTSFDRAFVVTRGAAEDADALRTVLKPALLVENRCKGVWLRSDGQRVSLSWRGLHADPLAVDAARDIVLAVAGWHRAESPYR